MNWLLIGLGGSLGAVLRFAISQALKPYSSSFPLATFTVNIIGSFLFGIILGLGLENNWQAGHFFLAGGFLGAFTTFSTFSFESVNLINQRKILLSSLYIGLHLLIGIAAAALGFYLI